MPVYIYSVWDIYLRITNNRFSHSTPERIIGFLLFFPVGGGGGGGGGGGEDLCFEGSLRMRGGGGGGPF